MRKRLIALLACCSICLLTVPVFAADPYTYSIRCADPDCNTSCGTVTLSEWICENRSYTKSGECRNCSGSKFIIRGRGHELGVVTVDATCTEAGSTSEQCSHCGYVKSSTAIPTLGHSFTVYRETAATCTEGGSH